MCMIPTPSRGDIYFPSLWICDSFWATKCGESDAVPGPDLGLKRSDNLHFDTLGIQPLCSKEAGLDTRGNEALLRRAKLFLSTANTRHVSKGALNILVPAKLQNEKHMLYWWH